MRYSTPAHVANGLRQLVTDLQAWRKGEDPGLDGVVCGHTDLIGGVNFSDDNAWLASVSGSRDRARECERTRSAASTR